MTKPQWIQSHSRKERGCMFLWPILTTIFRTSTSCGPWNCLMGFYASMSRKSQFATVVSSQELHKFLRLRTFSDNAWRARIKAQQVHGLHLSRLWFPLTWHPTAKWKGRAAQNIQEYCRKEDGEGGLAGNTQHPFRSIKTDDKQKIKQQAEWPSNTKCFSPSILTKKPCFSPEMSLSKPGANPSSSKSLGAFSALRVASLLSGQVFQEWKKNQW